MLLQQLQPVQVQEFSQNQQKHPVRINWLQGIYNRALYILLLCVNCVLHILYVSNSHNTLVYVCICTRYIFHRAHG